MGPIVREPAVTEMKSTAFGPPFDHADADTILRSSDQVDFPVYRVILSTSSPFFKSMFSLPQPDASISEKQNPVIDLTENSRTIAVLLTIIYPVVSVVTEPESLDDMIDALVAARKYDMAVASQRLIQKFTESKAVQDNPIVAFCAAYSHELGEAARVAARASLKHRMNLDNIGDKLQHINGPAFYQLFRFHRACSATAADAVSGTHLSWTTSSDAWWDLATATKCPSLKCLEYEHTVGPSRSSWTASAPYQNYMKRSRKLLLELPCRDAVTHHLFLKPSYEETSCLPCRTTMLGFPYFSRLLGEEIEKRVSKVDIELPF